MKIVWSEVRKKLRFNWKKDWFWIIFTIVMIFCVWGYRHDQALFREVISNPCKYCERCWGSGSFIEQPYQIPDSLVENISKNG